MSKHDNRQYLVSNLWAVFREEFPVCSRIPAFNMWAFGHFARGYFRVKLPISEAKL